jgi:hypothetical protein
VHGFDIELENKELFAQVLSNVEKIAQEENIEVIAVETNVRRITEPVLIWDFVHGGALGSVALLLRKACKTIYIAGALRYDQLFPYGTHPELDPLWGTETLTLIHDGNERQRLQKVEYISKNKLVLEHLRVCNQNLKDRYNCGKCSKCLKTMMELNCFISLKDTKTFPSSLDLNLVRKIYYDRKQNYHKVPLAILKELKSRNREPELQQAIEESLLNTGGSAIKKAIVNKIIYIDQNYNNRGLYKFIFTMNNKHDRNIFFKILVKLGLIK